MILPTEILKGMVDDIVSIDRYNTVGIKLMILNKQDTNFTIDDALIDIFSIEQNFAENTTDKIQLSINVTPQQIQQLVSKQSDLYVDMIIEYVHNKTCQPVLEEKPIILHYKAFVHDLSNITKRFGVNAFEKTDQTDPIPLSTGAVLIRVDMQLMTDIAYTVNKASFNGILKDVNVEEAMRYIASVMGIKKLKMITPDNTRKYKHLIIPPEYSSFRAAFDFIQSKYGVYANGFRHYITNDTLYIYPAFDMELDRDPQLNVIRVSENSYIGSANYHDTDDDNDLTIISNTKLNTQTLSNVGSENEGNAKVFVRSDGMFDGQVNTKDMSLTNITASMSSTDDLAISKGSAVDKYVKPTMNLYKHASTFSESNTELLSFAWINARIDSIEPGMPSTFIYDEKKSVVSKKGIVEYVKYSMTRSNRIMFTCSSALVLRGDPTSEIYEV